MNLRDESVLRELNLYPLWVQRGVPVAEETASSDVGLKPELPTPAAPRRSDFSPTQSEKSAPNVGLKPDLQEKSGVIAGSAEVQPATDWVTLKQQVRDCTACGLRVGCTQTVFGVGDERADWLFVGEGPGAEEDTQGEPFVGQAGQLLDNMLAAIQLKRGENVYITNVVKCRPPDNHNPKHEEVITCLPYLQQQIALIQPKLIIALGKVAATALLGRDATLGSLRGTLHDYHGTPLLVTFHPAYLLRSPVEKANAWQDLCRAVEQMRR